MCEKPRQSNRCQGFRSRIACAGFLRWQVSETDADEVGEDDRGDHPMDRDLRRQFCERRDLERSDESEDDADETVYRLADGPL